MTRGRCHGGRPIAITTKISWLDSKHSFSFGSHYDPATPTTGCCSSTTTTSSIPAPGSRPIPHRDMEIVTWVLRGSLVHQDSTGHSGVIYPGLAQRMSAGQRDPALREERLLAARGRRALPTRCTSCRCGWCPTAAGGTPGYEQLEIGDDLLRGSLAPVASGMARHATARRRSASATATPRCMRRGCSRGVGRAARGAVPASVRPASVGRRSKVPASSAPAMRCDSPRPAGSG